MRSHKARAGNVLAILPDVRWVNCHLPSAATQSRKAFDTRTELFEFWPATVR